MISEKLYTCTILNRNNVLLKIPPMVYDHLFVFVYLRVASPYVHSQQLRGLTLVILSYSTKSY